MIHTHLQWSDDIANAPKGETVTTTTSVLVKGKPVEREKTEHVPVKILALTNCGKVVQTYWMPPSKFTQGGEVLDGDRWWGFGHGRSPILWALWPDAAELSASLAAINATIVEDAA